ncbi:uncharacterized protein LOC133186540 [Saccostrea echinata]|uniref:uncharacterized protein LOC133186540 n=1 Tax=Saccostrea echinata TaxID=191078 RepID=UPI002A81F744|nr:uncharacterized protein LOC133186540 [Saccostrea echinata]
MVESTSRIETKIYSRTGAEEDLYNTGVTAICSVLMNYVETSRHIIFNKREKQNKAYEKFEEKLREISKSQLTFYYTGSQMQNLTAIHWRYPTPSTSHSMGRQCDSDVDVLLVDPKNCAGESKISHHGNHYVYEYSPEHPGYVRVYRGRGKGRKVISGKGFKKFWKEMVDKIEIHTRYTGRGTKFPSRGEKRSGPAITKVENVSMRNFINHDFVPAIKLTNWPSIAEDWTSRPRPGNWPPAELLENCVGADCHIVPVAHKGSSKHLKKKEWRLSFSGAEIVLANSLTFEQRQAVIMSKMILKLALQEVLQHKPSLKNCKPVSSYELKTSFYWLREKKNDWGSLTDDIRAILENLIQFLQRGILPDYFIPEKNITENVAPDLVEELSLTLKQVFTQQGLLCFLQKCFWYCYNTELEDFDSLDGGSLKCLYTELQNFCESQTPSLKLLIFTIIHQLLCLFNAAMDGTNSRFWVMDTKPVLFDIKCIQEGLMKRANFQMEVVNVNQLEDLFHEYDSFSFDLLSDLSDLLFGVLSQETVLETLGESIWCVVARLLARHCIAAGLYHARKQEVLDFASLLEVNPDNSALKDMAIQVHGSMENFQAIVARASDNADNVYQFYEHLCQDSLLFYFDVCKRFSVSEGFYCDDERIAVHGIESILAHIPDIMEDEMLWTPKLRQRVQLLMEKRKDFHVKQF